MASIDQTNKTISLWSMSGNQGSVWKQASVTIGDRQLSDYRVEMTATISAIITGDIAIDDIRTTLGSCSATTNTSAGQFSN